MYREPSPAGPKCALKTDPSAHARSSIRRRGAVRHLLSRASGGSVPFRSSGPRQLTGDYQHDAERDSQHRRQTQSPDDIALLDATRSSTPLRTVGSRSVLDALRLSQPGRRFRIPRESTLRFEMPSPPWSTTGELLNRASSGEDTNGRQPSENLPFTPRFAPAFAYRDEGSPQPHSAAVAPPSPFPRPDGPAGEDASDATMRSLRRVGHRSVGEANQQAALRRPMIDGLGDRQRSFSPDEDRESDAWETLLTTITPDATLPSADSSFASTAASASTNPMRDGASNRQTQPTSLGSSSTTMHMILDPYPEYLHPCDFPDFTSDSDTEAELDLESRPPAALRRHRHTRSRYSSGVGSTQDSQPPITILSRTPTRPSISSLPPPDPASDLELQQMQAIVDRLARREDIPDEWWAAAGLSRTMGRRLEVGRDSPNLASPETAGNATGEL